MTSDGAAAKKSAGGTSFDRIKPANTAEPKAGPVVDARVDDVLGKRALFSGADQPRQSGQSPSTARAVTVVQSSATSDCSS